MKLFQINFMRLEGLLLPTFLRKPIIMAFLQSAAMPVIFLHNYFSINRDENLVALQMNGQLCRLRSFLNRKFPEAGNQITITDGIGRGEWRLAWDEALFFNNCLLIDNTLFWSTAAIRLESGGFTVNVPSSSMPENSRHQLVYYLNTYKLLSKPYVINYY